MTNRDVLNKLVSYDDLVWFANICIRIGISDKRALDNNVIDDEEWFKMRKMMDVLQNF